MTRCTELDLGEPGNQREAGYEAAGHLVLAHSDALLAALAVLVGLLAVLAWDSKGVKALLVSMALAITTSILFIPWLGCRGQW